MADILSEGVVQRTDIVPFMNTGKEETPTWDQMGAGWTKFSESPNAQTKSKKYINEKTERESVTRYKPKFDFEADLMHADPTIQKAYDKAINGNDATSGATKQARGKHGHGKHGGKCCKEGACCKENACADCPNKEKCAEGACADCPKKGECEQACQSGCTASEMGTPEVIE